MNVAHCPHCKGQRIVTSRIPKDVIVILPCPACQELVVLFRNKVIALKRDILERGSKDEKTAHLAEIIAEFLEPGMFSMFRGDADEAVKEMADALSASIQEREGGETPPKRPPKGTPISQREYERFVRVELQRIDEAGYFKKYFGR